MTEYAITPDGSIRSNWMNFMLIYAVPLSTTQRLNLCMGFHLLPSSAIMLFRLTVMAGTFIQSSHGEMG